MEQAIAHAYTRSRACERREDLGSDRDRAPLLSEIGEAGDGDRTPQEPRPVLSLRAGPPAIRSQLAASPPARIGSGLRSQHFGADRPQTEAGSASDAGDTGAALG